MTEFFRIPITAEQAEVVLWAAHESSDPVSSRLLIEVVASWFNSYTSDWKWRMEDE